MMIVEPVILRPLRAEWESIKAQIIPLAEKASGIVPRSQSPGDRRAADTASRKLRSQAMELRDAFLHRLANIRILDPACGSGNFLYLALQGVKDLENRAVLECEALELSPRALEVGPEIVHGIEINPFAAELARTTIWIGDIQWRRRNGIYSEPPPILRKLDAIECRDALITKRSEGSFVEAGWPAAEFIVGNPPFLGDKFMRESLGGDYTETLREIYLGRVPGGADLVCYWFDKAEKQLCSEAALRVGLVSTNSIRGGANRAVLDRIAAAGRIFAAWSNEEWTIEGAAVRVSLVCFDHPKPQGFAELDSRKVEKIHSDLSSRSTDMTTATALPENANTAFNGISKKGAFDIVGDLARAWLMLPLNPNGRPNSDVLFPWLNGEDVTARGSGKWIINFGEMSLRAASLYEAPFQHIAQPVKSAREKSGSVGEKKSWWLLARRAPAMFSNISSHHRLIATPETPTHTVFAWLPTGVVPDKNLIVISRSDDTSFGILHSRFHIAWARALGSPYGNHPTARRYNSSRVFRTFPFPKGLTPNIPAKDYENDPRAQTVARAARRLDELRNAWLNPPDLVKIEPEVVPGYPDRILPKDAQAAVTLKTRTLTNLYNQRPQWLTDVHRDLDAAVAAAYGWPADISEEDALAKLLEINLARAALNCGEGEVEIEEDNEPAED
ncbi:class I SAM-dependent DNA methyltransferase [Bradyrhizobium erythrophlei]|uniref:class I SAM-dependent DNA methyltransferase n=1 Tax=Bradyrhizobium erythrophlei TaxID=1437360 RepID=UPI0018D3AD4E|nr:class I SAM-dependent DNA methyltransferase [Bradyrhizobium erythrophlei]